MFYASIDIGSNTTLLLIVEQQKDQPLRVVEDHSRVTGLGRDVQKTLRLSREAMDDTHKVLSEYVDICQKYEIQPQDCFITATQASRIATNAQDFFALVLKDLGLKVRIISSDQEALYTAKGVAAFDQLSIDEPLTIMDIGGASTEFMQVEVSPFSLVKTISLPVGSVVCHEWLSNGEFDSKISQIIKSSQLSEYRTPFMTCVAGSMTAVAGMIMGLDRFDADLINGSRVKMEDFEDFVNRLEALSLTEINKKYPFLEKRSATIKAGAKLALTLCKEVDVAELRISTYGLRHGSVWEAIHG